MHDPHSESYTVVLINYMRDISCKMHVFFSHVQGKAIDMVDTHETWSYREFTAC